MIVIVDYGVGNLSSVSHKMGKLKIDAIISDDVKTLMDADKIILPGVGSFAAGMGNLRELGLIEILKRKVVEERTPILGICLGMQLFSKHSEEGDADGLGWVDCETKKFVFDDGKKLRVPHVGWNTLSVVKDSPLLDSVPADMTFYFTHSYHLSCREKDILIATTAYGYDFPSVIQKDNIFGVQFHPEKSHKRGMQIIKNFVDLI
ncbi:MAG: imidazole glycerol phosphate synthase subunit HisH [Candidatus Altiarchaeota archaeon]